MTGRGAEPQGPQPCERRLRTLVAIEPAAMQAVVAAARERIGQGKSEAVAAPKPVVCLQKRGQMAAVFPDGRGGQGRFGHRRGLDRLLVVGRLNLAPRVPVGVAHWPEDAVGRGLANEEAKRVLGHLQKRPVRPALGRGKQAVREHGVGVGHPRFKPRPAWSVRPLVGVGEPQCSVVGDGLQFLGLLEIGLPEMRPRHDHVGLRPEATQLGQCR